MYWTDVTSVKRRLRMMKMKMKTHQFVVLMEELILQSVNWSGLLAKGIGISVLSVKGLVKRNVQG